MGEGQGPLDWLANLYVWELVLRLEAFLRPCHTYRATWDQRTAAVLSYNTLFSYVYFVCASYAHRQLRLVVLVGGLAVVTLLLFTVDNLTAPLRQGPVPCAAHPEAVRLSEEAAVITYLACFLWLHTVVLAPSPVRFVVYAALLLAYWASSLWALLHVDLHAPTALLGGVAAGLTAAFLTFRGFHWLHLRRDYATVQRGFDALCITEPTPPP